MIEKHVMTLTEGQGGGKARISIAVHEQTHTPQSAS